MTTRDAEHAGIAIVHQELMLVPELSVAANLALGRETGGGLFGRIDDDAIEAHARELLAKFGVERDIDPGRPSASSASASSRWSRSSARSSQDAKIRSSTSPPRRSPARRPIA